MFNQSIFDARQLHLTHNIYIVLVYYYGKYQVKRNIDFSLMYKISQGLLFLIPLLIILIFILVIFRSVSVGHTVSGTLKTGEFLSVRTLVNSVNTNQISGSIYITRFNLIKLSSIRIRNAESLIYENEKDIDKIIY